MGNQHYNVLFLCTGNSARSILAEVLLNNLGRERFTAYSMGGHPTDAVNPHALRPLDSMRLPIEGLRNKSLKFKPMDRMRLREALDEIGRCPQQEG